MKRTFPGRAAVPALLMMAALAAAGPAPASAQDAPERTECRCVDADGNEIEGCRCLRELRADRFELPEIMGRMFAPGADRPRVGITLDPEQPAEYDAEGARIVELLEDGPADEAGLREGDIVVRFDGHDLRSGLDPELEEEFELDRSVPVQRLLALARRLEPGQEVEVEYLRDGERRTTTVEARGLERWGARIWSMPGMRDRGRHFEMLEPGEGRFRFRVPDEGRFELRGPEGRAPRTFVLGGDGRFDRCPAEGGDEAGPTVHIFGDLCPGGLRLVALNPGLAEYFDTDEGVLVADVHEESALGLRPGDVILSIGTREADSPDRVRSILRSYEEDEPVTFHIVRDGRSMDVQGRLGR